MASIFLHHVVGDLTVGKPDLVEFPETGTVEAAIRAIAEGAEGAITVWRASKGSGERKVGRFVGMLNSLDLVAFLARAGDQERAMRMPVSEVVEPDPTLLKEVDPFTRLIDALDMMKQGARRLLVRKSLSWRGVSKRFSILYSGKWLNNFNDSANSTTATGKPSSSSLHSSHDHKYCCLSREDIIRFLIGCLGALAPLPLSSISSLGATTPHYYHVEASAPAIEAVRTLRQDPCAAAVVETNPDGTHKIVGEISSYKLWKCDYLPAAWALANLSAGHFVMGSEDNDGSRLDSLSNLSMASSIGESGASPSSRPKKFSSRSIGFFSNLPSPMEIGGLRPARRSMYRGRSAPLTCKHTSSLAAVMAQMLSHRATHIWVTEADSEEDDVLVGLVSYNDILYAVTKYPTSSSATPANA
ncbi:CBS domain-containing protein CBSX6 [Iris pallida]|uniref:CBS domain-containing protein CBSX6 n=1 Tax=Iris pallida TaxID=29817 RepID=A0AAX6I3F0_IRIPA|nr:CBS domain-containing protein CBSX6 [Iris pallida]KAJ6847357.1 CBS domain-containing protein CBSX6 [Iris pallida]